MKVLAQKNSRPVAIALIAVLSAFLGISSGLVGEPTGSGTIITNRAEATYDGGDGSTYRVASETVTFTVLAVPSLTVGPKETTPSSSIGPQERIERLFTICNAGNVNNSYVVTSIEIPSPAKLVIIAYDNDDYQFGR